jgi:hypothetical protein
MIAARRHHGHGRLGDGVRHTNQSTTLAAEVVTACAAALRDLDAGEANPTQLPSMIPPHTTIGRYAGFLPVDATARHGAAFHAMIASSARIPAAERAVADWDICSYSNSRSSFAYALRAALDGQADADVAVEDWHTYNAARFTGDDVDKGDR